MTLNHCMAAIAVLDVHEPQQVSPRLSVHTTCTVFVLKDIIVV